LAENDKSKKLDDFWDLSDLVPKKKVYSSAKKSIDTVEIEIDPLNVSENQNKDNTKLTFSDMGTIKRTVTYDRKEDEKTLFESVEQYQMSESPIHKVTLKKHRCDYHFYNEFRKMANGSRQKACVESEYIPYFSYVPQYDQLNENQLSYYLWWRKNFEEGSYLKTDYSYVLLYVFELINIGDAIEPKRAQYLLTEIWNVYHEKFPALEGKLSAWICDYSLIHRLSPPENADSRIVKSESSLKEFYISMPSGDPKKCVRSLIKYCSSYDYRASKFASGDNRAIFDKHIFDSLVYAWCNYNGGKGFLEGFAALDSRMVREAYAGALCCSQEKYKIELEYCSFSRMNELRYHIGDMIKYAENKIRAAIGTKSRLMIYSSNPELYKVIDEYFAAALPPRSRVPKKARERQEYDVLYETPKKEFSLSDAKRIEEDSWGTTNELVTAFEEDFEDSVKEEGLTNKQEDPEPLEENADKTLADALGELLGFAIAVKTGDKTAQDNEAKILGKLKDSIVDEINDIAVESIGDILIEDGADGYEISEFYCDLL
jgi:hypothetical protein